MGKSKTTKRVGSIQSFCHFLMYQSVELMARYWYFYVGSGYQFNSSNYNRRVLISQGQCSAGVTPCAIYAEAGADPHVPYPSPISPTILSHLRSYLPQEVVRVWIIY